MDGRERGQILPIVTVVIVLVGLVCLAAGRLGAVAVTRARAVTAADAAALAGAAAGPRAAGELAVANGASVAGYEQAGSDARVAVRVGERGVGARARARRSGAPAGAPAGPTPALRAAMARAAQLLGRPVPTVPPGPGEPPGAARLHARGLAVDVARPALEAVVAVVAGAGLCRPWPESHPGHLELCPPPPSLARGP